ncbi:AAA family ATPase [Candidatus Woesearchaeota archaeon]|nr:AAA family ATPase [Candidatus Woesearchaeota archaeon]
MLVIGFTGKMCAGKDAAAAILQQRGFEFHSLSDAIRAEADKRGLERTRENLRNLGNELRATHGPSVLGERMKELMTTEKVVLVSIRNPAEVEALRQIEKFVLVTIDAPTELRFEREVARGREDPPASVEELLEREELENKADPNNQQLDATMALADETIMNDSSLQELGGKVLALLEKYHG